MGQFYENKSIKVFVVYFILAQLLFIFILFILTKVQSECKIHVIQKELSDVKGALFHIAM